MCKEEDCKKIVKLYGNVVWVVLTCLQVLCHYWAGDYFRIYLN